MAKKISGQAPAAIIKGSPKKHRIKIKDTGDPVVDHADKDITDRLHHELSKRRKR